MRYSPAHWINCDQTAPNPAPPVRLPLKGRRHQGFAKHPKIAKRRARKYGATPPQQITLPPLDQTAMAQRPTTQRDRDRATIRRAQPACHICGQPIDYTLPHLDPGEYVVDHLLPLHLGGGDDLTNKAAAHRRCNAAKAARIVAPVVRRSGSII